MLESGIIKEKDSRYTFRLNGIFEYFLAYYIYHNPDFKSEIIENDDIYLTFKNELEIYSGFNRNDEEFLENIFNKTKSIFDDIITKNSSLGNLDEVLMHKLGEANEMVEFIKDFKVKKAISHEIQDTVKDFTDPLESDSEVHLKQDFDTTKLNSEILEKYLNILARVFKNSDNISNTVLICDIFEYLVDAYANFGFFLIDEFSNLSKTENGEFFLNEESGDIEVAEELLKIITNFIPVLTQVLLYDGIGHRNLTKVIESYIKKLKEDTKNNQYKLFLMYFLLLDIDLKSNKKHIDEIFEKVTLAPLKVSTFFKMNFYLAFKAYKNKDLEAFFKNKVQEAQMRIENKTDSGKLNKYLSTKQKGNIVRKHKDK